MVESCLLRKQRLKRVNNYGTAVYSELGHFYSYDSVGIELMIFAAKNGFKIGQIKFDVRELEGQSRFGQILPCNYKIICAMFFAV